MFNCVRLIGMIVACFPLTVWGQAEKPAMVISPEAYEIHHSGMLFDGHNDLPYAMRMKAGSSFDKVDIAEPTDFHTDIPRLRAGGLKAQFWSVYVPASTDLTGNALIQTLEQIQLVHDMCDRYPDVFEMADTAADVRRICASGKIASMCGVEGGHSIQNSLQVLRTLYEKGVRYMTLTHSKTLAWADSATDDPKNDGLSPFGKEVVREMNKLGMLVDLSHVSPKCMRDALEITEAPVIFSHSSARAICDHPRNVPDDILKLTAENGGVVMVNFMSGYVVPTDQLAENKRARGDHKIVCDHIEHIINVAGIDHVGIGSDYDGVSSLPVGLDDVSYYPNLTQELLNRGYDREQIHKILGGNVLRALAEAEQVATRIQSKTKTQPAADPLFTIAVSAGPVDRKDVLVQAKLNSEIQAETVTLRDPQGNSFVGQIAPPSIGDQDNTQHQVLLFMLPELAANQTLELSAYPSGLNSNREFKWQDDNRTAAELQYGDLPVLKYMYEALDESTPERRGETYKIYHHVYSPDGSRLITKGPGGLFPHHRGLFFGFNRITYGDNQKADVWHCSKGESQSHETSVRRVGGPIMGRDVNLIFWRGQDGKPFAKELREMSAYRVGGSTMIEFNSTLESLGGSVKLDGDPQHAGFQFRASQDVPDKTKNQTYYIRPDGKGEPGKFRNWSAKQDKSDRNPSHVNLPWNAVSIVLPIERRQRGSRTELETVDQRFTVCYLDHPDNPKPARFSERDYARFGSYFEYTLTPEQPLRLRYRIFVHEGELSVDEIAAISQDFIAPVTAKVN